MSVYKELFNLAEEVEKNQSKIHPDAADYGVRIESKDDPIIRQLKGLRELHKGKTDTDTYGTGATQRTIIEGLNEWTDGSKVVFEFVYIHINKEHRRKGDPMGYLYVQKSLGYGDN